MKKFTLLLISLVGVLQFLTCQTTQIVNGREFIVHTVKRGETLYGISKKYQIPQDTILAYNKSANTGVKADQVLTFPSGNTVQHAGSNFIEHIVKQGETLYGIAKKYNVTVEDIEKYNPQVKTGLRYDEVLKIPTTSNTNNNNDPLINGNQNNNNVSNSDSVNTNSQSGSDTLSCDSLIAPKKNYKIAIILPFKGNNAASSKIATEFY